MIFPDISKLGLRYTFYEGLGSIEYGEFLESNGRNNKSQRNSLVTEVRSDRSFNQKIEQDYTTNVLKGLGIHCELKISK